ncbi:hypothetical protein DLM45_06650 [Hyphomicrobium methylovorum]|uniref:hypothetical protein n=1 Tax=Hyphomicrobium methylovorum TaxID=84 RepID=UPI0015E7E2BA|nr:hypothetical protein [Hyphomicrobium methylovorum]MBA2125902.1 hypothetical protein [Hyphomicrobium methylovorum]
MSGRKKTRPEQDSELNESLKETFPGSDALASNVTDDPAVRPVNRQPPKIDKDLVDRLAKQAKQAGTKNPSR